MKKLYLLAVFLFISFVFVYLIYIQHFGLKEYTCKFDNVTLNLECHNELQIFIRNEYVNDEGWVEVYSNNSKVNLVNIDNLNYLGEPNLVRIDNFKTNETFYLYPKNSIIYDVRSLDLFEYYMDRTNYFCKDENICLGYSSYCNNWRVFNYNREMKVCYYGFTEIFKYEDIDICKRIENKEVATYCINLVLRNHSDYYFDWNNWIKGDKKLLAVSKLSDFSQLIIFDNGKYKILGNCSYMSSESSCSGVVWQETD